MSRGWGGGWDVLSLDTFCELRSHTRVHLHCSAVHCFLKYSHSQVPCTWANFKDLIRRAEVGLDRQARVQSQSCIEGIKTNLVYNSKGKCFSFHHNPLKARKRDARRTPGL